VVVGILSHNLWPKALVAGLRLGGDAWLAVMAATGVLVFGVLFGMLLAVGASLLLAIRRSAQPLLTELGQLPDTRDYQDRERHPEAIRTPGLLIVRTEEPLFFANAEQLFQVVATWAARDKPHTVLLSLEMCDDLDATATEALAELAARLAQSGVRLSLARVKDRVRDTLTRGHLVGTPGVIAGVFWSVDDAVQATLGEVQPDQQTLL